MKPEKVLEKLEELLRDWGLTKDDWVFTGEYAWRLQSYKFKPRKGHIDIFVDRNKLPWKAGEMDASAIPSKKSKEAQELRKFIKETGFGPHFLPVPIQKAKWQTIQRIISQSKIYNLKNGREIRIHKVSNPVIDRANVLMNIGIKTWDKPKIKRWLEDFIYFKKFAEKKNDKRVVEICNSVLEKCKDIRKELEIMIKEEKIPSETSQIKGEIAFKGKVKGGVKIIFHLKDLSKLKNGEILVTPMTTPDFILAIAKAKAIVTDEGGIGCHAAVISREFKIPCIIGTKIATKVLRDGQMIEVDANKGIIRIIK